jgi:DNA mismatch repair protein MutS
MLDERKSNYIASIYIDGGDCSAAFCDLSTGQMAATKFETLPGGVKSKSGGEIAAPPVGGARGASRGATASASEHILNELVRFAPSELLLNLGAAVDFNVKYYISKHERLMTQTVEAFYEIEASRALCLKHFAPPQDVPQAELISQPAHTDANTPQIAPQLLDPVLLKAVGSLLGYLRDTQKNDLTYINRVEFYTAGQYMELDLQTRRNLELTETLRTGEKRGSLLWVLDKTKTSMGARLLRSWLEKPLLSPGLIRRRLFAVDELSRSLMKRGEIMLLLKDVEDIERLTTRVVYGNASARDLAALSRSAAVLPELKEQLAGFKSAYLMELAELDDLQVMRDIVSAAITDEPPFSVREGGIIRKGFDAEVDRLCLLTENSKSALAEIETSERERTGVKVKVGYNRVFGYFIEVPRGKSNDVPENYTRRQTLANAERFITPELKQLESDLLTARERLHALEYELFSNVCQSVSAMADAIRRAALDVAAIDVLCSLAEVAAANDYCMPDVDLSDTLNIIDGRHPVVEQTQSNSLFVPNNAHLNISDNRIAIITGPNMAGKSTYMRQTALIALMAQIGSFVPAKSATVGILDRVFTRIGASDDLAGGQSTFMVEMTEVAQILRSATTHSLILLDEIGRGTSTYDGMAIARAVLEHCSDKDTGIGAKTLFATHYHELSALERELQGVKNFQVSVKKRGTEIVFLRRIIPGGADRSYGVEVAKLAGLPEKVIRRARALLLALEDAGASAQGFIAATPERETLDGETRLSENQMSIEQTNRDAVIDKLSLTDLNTLSPIEAMNLLFELKKELGN